MLIKLDLSVVDLMYTGLYIARSYSIIFID